MLVGALPAVLMALSMGLMSDDVFDGFWGSVSTCIATLTLIQVHGNNRVFPMHATATQGLVSFILVLHVNLPKMSFSGRCTVLKSSPAIV